MSNESPLSGTGHMKRTMNEETKVIEIDCGIQRVPEEVT